LILYNLDESINTAKYRVLLEVGDNGLSTAFLENSINQKKIRRAIKAELATWLKEKSLYKIGLLGEIVFFA